MSEFTFHTTPKIVVRPGAAAQAAEICGEIVGKHVLFVTDKGIRSVGLEQPAIASLETAGHIVTVFDGVEADPSLATLERAVLAARDCGATGVLALGGGSSLDIAKLTALLAGSGESIDDAGVLQMPKDRVCLWFLSRQQPVPALKLHRYPS